MFVDLRSVIGRAIFMKGEFDPIVFEPLISVLKPGGVFLDVGANVGYYSLLARDIVGTSGKVHAFEVDPRPLRCLRRTIQVGGFMNISMHEVAVGDVDGERRLVMRGECGHSSVQIGREGLVVQMTTLDSWRKKHPQGKLQAIKLDIEGGELSGLRGAVNLLREEHPVLVCELIEEHDGRKFSEPDKIFALLESLGYRWRWLEGACDPTIVAR
jgi:FkbM family methyltransferase